MSSTVRKALASDGDLILSLVEALAAYEKLAPPDQEAGKRLLADLFSLAKLEIPDLLPSPQAHYYRHKVQLPFGFKKQGRLITLTKGISSVSNSCRAWARPAAGDKS